MLRGFQPRFQPTGFQPVVVEFEQWPTTIEQNDEQWLAMQLSKRESLMPEDVKAIQTQLKEHWAALAQTF